MTTTRMMKFRIPMDLLLDMFTTGKVTELQCITGLPKGARYISHHLDVSTFIVHIVVEHSSFEPLDMGEYIPEVTIRLSEIPKETEAVEVPTNLIQ